MVSTAELRKFSKVIDSWLNAIALKYGINHPFEADSGTLSIHYPRENRKAPRTP